MGWLCAACRPVGVEGRVHMEVGVISGGEWHWHGDWQQHGKKREDDVEPVDGRKQCSGMGRELWGRVGGHKVLPRAGRPVSHAHEAVTIGPPSGGGLFEA